ncbi:MAG: bifunctional 4-hydroxy-2-oxoglutarate aldolase/2-dehydro-3-deoxy-phosphogluconate aldolase [Clostridiales bacterium]|nr:bifunctional 4-hydroxy-2-oxoglutarate aldolase/2-dehydro-3-deoxy-phosphogluconate aldolase [Clostridiales bacterium]
MTNEQKIERIKQTKIVPVVVLNSIEETLPKMQALVDGGLPCAEITFRTPCAAQAIALTVKTFPDMFVGAGTVINREQCERAIEAGSQFIVSPGFSEEVADCCKKHDMLYLPGVVTPTEVMAAVAKGLTTLKFFPASNFGGLKTIKAICAAFPYLKIMPTGGISADNILEYLAYDKIIACGGSWMMNGTPKEIKEKTKKAVELVK